MGTETLGKVPDDAGYGGGGDEGQEGLLRELEARRRNILGCLKMRLSEPHLRPPGPESSGVEHRNLLT